MDQLKATGGEEREESEMGSSASKGSRVMMIIGALAVLLVVLAAGCGGGDEETAPPSAEPAPVEEPAPTESASAEETATADEAPAEPASGDPVKIGVIEMLTGGSGYYGSVLLDGIQLATEKINAEGGIGGRPIELVVEDNASDDAQTVTLTRKLAGDEEIVAIIAPTFLPNLIAGQAIANEVGVTYLAAQGLLAPANEPWSFKNTIPFEAYLEAQLTGIMTTLELKKVATVVNQDNAAQVLFQELGTPILEGLGVDEAAVVKVSEAQSNYGPQIAQLLDVEPEAIVLDLTTEDGSRFMLQARGRGFEGYFVAGDGGLSDNRIFELSQGAGEGLIATDDVSPSDQRTIDFVEAYSAAYPDKGFTDKFATWGYDMAILLAQAMNSAESLDRVGVRDALAAIEECEGCIHAYLHEAGDPETNPRSRNFVEPRTYFTELTPDGFVTWPLLADATVCESLDTPGCSAE